jgi:hypothetical protein
MLFSFIITKTIRVLENACGAWDVCSLLSTIFVWNVFQCDKYLVEYTEGMCINACRSYVKGLLLLTGCSQNWNVLPDFGVL